MVRFLLITILLSPILGSGQKHGLSVDDLLTLSSLSPKSYDNYLEKKGFIAGSRGIRENMDVTTFFEKKTPTTDSGVIPISRTIDMFKKDGAFCFILQTSCKEEFQQGRNALKRAGFFYDNKKDTSRKEALMFQKGAVTVVSSEQENQEGKTYKFLLEKKEMPDPGEIQYGEDLLKFDSHEHLASFFGAKNVRKDTYFFSEKESSKCSILFPNSSRQVVFIWDDQDNLFKVSFIIIGGVLSATSTVQYSGNFINNIWMLRSGIYSGMRIKDLLKLNQNDFTFYGKGSEYSMMIVPEKTRYIDFTKIGVMMDCFDCGTSDLLKAPKVSALDAADSNLALYVSCIMISP
ncbi:MAG: hypothetical protein H7Y42_09300 [Chitinophagaceae bacterium]|nr:hypothetical protein [Chitinophagaceae bacterium]